MLHAVRHRAHASQDARFTHGSGVKGPRNLRLDSSPIDEESTLRRNRIRFGTILAIKKEGHRGQGEASVRPSTRLWNGLTINKWRA